MDGAKYQKRDRSLRARLLGDKEINKSNKISDKHEI